MIEVLNKPYPFYFTLRRNLIVATVIGFFIGVVYFILTEQSISGKYVFLSKPQKSLGFALITFISIMLVFDSFPKFLISDKQKENWTIFKQFSIISFLLLVIAIFNSIFILFIAKDISYFLSIKFALTLFLTTLILGLIPSFIVVWADYTIKLKENLRQSFLNNENLKSIIEIKGESSKEIVIKIPSENKNEIIKIDLKSLFFIKSEGNYIEVYIKKNGQINIDLFRASIQAIDNELKDFSNIIRTHRSFIVNINKIEFSEGTARNYQLFFSGIKESVPVARSRFQNFNKALLNEMSIQNKKVPIQNNL